MSPQLTFISAGAGSGKTWRLTEILRHELSAGGVHPEGVIATTFTNRAATELRERVREHLLAGGDLALATAIGQARIGTVNSVCGGLLQRFAFEAGLSPELRVIEEAEARVLISQQLGYVLDARTLSTLGGLAWRLGIEDWKVAVHELVNQARANDIAPERLAGFAQQSADELLSHFPKPTKSDLDTALTNALKTARAALQKAAAGTKVKKTHEYLDLVKDALGFGGPARHPWSDWVWLDREAPEKKLAALAEPVAAIAAKYPQHPRLHDDIRCYLTEIFAVAAQVLEGYAAVKRELGALDFTDQEQLLLKCLDHPVVAATLKDELELLLVDEFQDTSPIQLALFVRLCAFARRVYWVGDLKQAIYGFRGSDTALMRAVVKGLPRLGGEKEILGKSWRSRPCLVKLVNQAFVPAFAAELDEDEVRLEAERDELPRQPAFANWVLEGRNNDLRAGALGAAIRSFLDSGSEVFDKTAGALRAVRAADIAVLCRSNERVGEVTSALAAAGIATSTDRPGLLAQPEAVLALACLRRLNDRGDTLASAQVISLCDGAAPEDWLADRLAHLRDNLPEDAWREEGGNAHPVLRLLAALRPQLQLLAPREALSLVIAQADLSRRVLAWGGGVDVGRQRLANLEALLALATQYEDICRGGHRPATVSGLLLWLDAQEAAGTDALATAGVDAVTVLTHHGAKGLEWPVVILLDLDAPARSRLWGVACSTAGKIDILAALANREIRYWPWPFGKLRKVPLADDVADGQVGRDCAKAAEDEDRRLLYVSMTRARDLLVFARGGGPPAADTWLGRLDAPWLTPAGDDRKVLSLPDGSRVPYARTTFAPFSPSPCGRGSGGGVADPPSSSPVHWFTERVAPTPHLPLYLNPSACDPVPCTPAPPVRLGSRIPIRSGADMARLGTAIHACIAASLADPTQPLAAADLGRILAALGCAGDLAAEDVQAQITALERWLREEASVREIHVEVPVESVDERGQVLRGQIDLLGRTDAGFVIVDHKSNPGGMDTWAELARGHSGQLAGYERSVSAGTGVKVVGRHLFLAVAGGRIEVRGGEGGA